MARPKTFNKRETIIVRVSPDLRRKVRNAAKAAKITQNALACDGMEAQVEKLRELQGRGK